MQKTKVTLIYWGLCLFIFLALIPWIFHQTLAIHSIQFLAIYGGILLHELKTYDPSLLDKSIWLAINKRDTLEEEKQEALIKLIKKKMSSINLNNEGVIAISGFTGDETGKLLGMIANKMSETQN